MIKWSVTDCQIVLVNMARALKYLEDFGQRQSQLFKVLEKYHLLPDNFENLQSQFGFLKQATSENIEHLQQAINVQQMCTASAPASTKDHNGARQSPNKHSGH